MCGIWGVVESPGREANTERFEQALRLLDHRGPNGRHCVSVDDRTILGHTRLSIIDLSEASSQPMALDGRYWLTYNGELFNYIELRSELEAQGCRFTTSGDTEVLFRALIHWGHQATHRFHGMWAFAMYDEQERTLFCSRDRFGIKPFNYHAEGGRFLFSSEIKPLLSYDESLAEPDYPAIASFCRSSVGAQHEQTWFKRVRRLQPGCNLLVGADGSVNIDRYWDYPQERVTTMTEAEACRTYRDLFDKAIALRMRSDVPLGITLSSGLDSTSIAYVMQQCDPVPHHSFTASYHAQDLPERDATVYVDRSERVEEAILAEQVATQLGLQSHIVKTSYENFLGDMKRIIWHLESGNSSPAVLPLMQLFATVRQHVTVVMDGQGADELLAGYVTSMIWPMVLVQLARGHFRCAWASLRVYARTYTLRSALAMALRHAANKHPWLSRLQQRLTGLSSIYGPKMRRLAHIQDYPDRRAIPGDSAVGRSLLRQHSGGLVNLLHYGDAISMANSVEARMPFLDFRLVEFVWGLPDEFKIRNGIGKMLHRKAMRGLVPDSILGDPVKFGFSTPISEFFRQASPASQACIDMLLDDRTLSRGVFERAGLNRVIADHRRGRRDHGPLLFRLLSTELWFRTFIDADRERVSAIG